VVVSAESRRLGRDKSGDGPDALFDTENPLAWVESDDALALGRMA